jgi:hypothetical protein
MHYCTFTYSLQSLEIYNIPNKLPRRYLSFGPHSVLTSAAQHFSIAIDNEASTQVPQLEISNYCLQSVSRRERMGGTTKEMQNVHLKKQNKRISRSANRKTEVACTTR